MLNSVSNNANDSCGDKYATEIYTRAEFDSVGEEEEDDGCNLAVKEHYHMQLLRSSPPDEHINAEHIQLHLPSYLGCSWCNKNAAKDLAKAELHL